MQALKLPALSGWAWIGGGWRLFRKQPFSFVALLFFCWLLLLSASAIIGWIAQAIGVVLPFVPFTLLAVVGALLVAMIKPVLTVGFLQACRMASDGLPVQPVILFAPFRAGRETLTRLFALGSIEIGAVLCIVLLTSGTAGLREPPAIEPAGTEKAASTATTPPAKASPAAAPDGVLGGMPTEAQQQAMAAQAVVRLKQGLAYLPVTLILWYAPMLIAWYRLPPGKAIFFSVIAVWRNLGAFVVFGAAWIAIWMAFSLVTALILSMLGLASLITIVTIPLVILLMTWMCCSVYPTYATVFVDRAAAPPAATT